MKGVKKSAIEDGTNIGAQLMILGIVASFSEVPTPLMLALALLFTPVFAAPGNHTGASKIYGTATMPSTARLCWPRF
jgi:hypothetical protein